MKRTTLAILGLVATGAIAAGAGYWMGQHGAAGAVAARGIPAASTSAPRKLLYYRNPMGLPDMSPTPKKDPMGMDYVAVYEEGDGGQAASATRISLNTDKVQKLGVRTEAAGLKALGKVVRAIGRVEPDERRTYTIAPKFEGYVERLHVNATGQTIGKGQALFEVYSPDLMTAQREYLIAQQGVQSLEAGGGDAQAGMKQLAAAGLQRLKNWDISDEQLRALEHGGAPRRTLTFRSPVSGIVTEKKAVQGMRFMPGDMLYQITDLSTVWVLADVFEQDIGAVRLHAKATVMLDAYPGRTFDGEISYVYPTLKAETRTATVRVELSNAGQLLKPGMFARVDLAVPAASRAVTVPLSAVIDSGTRRIVLVQVKEGQFEPREVRLGMRSDTYVEVLDGVQAGELVVVAANFLIDAESNLKAAEGGFGHPGHGAAQTGSSPSADGKTSAAPARQAEGRAARAADIPHAGH
jgi:Cu(I)/Ag(I) efflux system membrane fusion protein